MKVGKGKLALTKPLSTVGFLIAGLGGLYASTSGNFGIGTLIIAGGLFIVAFGQVIGM